MTELTPEAQLRVAYQLLLGREPDAEANRTHLEALRSGARSAADLVDWITSSAEWLAARTRHELGPSLHESRCRFVRSLPSAARILDLGGTALHEPRGALVGALGYPYRFDELVIVDLPDGERHERYRDGADQRDVATPQGPVRYRQHSMTNLSGLGTAAFDLVYLGEVIEHVDRASAPTVLKEAHRVLRPSGHLALDTPNARVARLQQATFLDPDHRYEYTHAEMRHLLCSSRFEVVEQRGLNLASGSVRSCTFDLGEVARNVGEFAAIEDCYLLAYLCRPA